VNLTPFLELQPHWQGIAILTAAQAVERIGG